MKIQLSPFGRQRDVIESVLQNMFTVVAAGRGVGKTVVAMMVIMLWALRNPGHRIIYCAPTYVLAESVYKDMLFAPGFQTVCGYGVGINGEQPQPWIRFPGGAVCKFFSMERADRSIRGQRANLAIVDECREIRERDFKTTLMPITAPLRGKMLLLSTFKGPQDHWYYAFHKRGLSPNLQSIKSFLIPAPEGICYQGEAGREALEIQRAIMSDAEFRVEYMCESISTGQHVFKTVHIHAAIGGEAQPGSRAPTLLAVDLGKVADPTSLLIINESGHFIHEEVFPLGQDFDMQIARIAKLAEQYNAQVVVETNGTNRDGFIDLIRPRMPNGVLDIPIRRHNKEDLVHKAVFAMETRRVKIPASFRETLSQLSSYEYRPKGDYISFACPDRHDDLVSAFVLAVNAYLNGWLPGASAVPFRGVF